MPEKNHPYVEPRTDAHDLQINLSFLSSSPTGESYDRQVTYDDGFDE